MARDNGAELFDEVKGALDRFRENLVAAEDERLRSIATFDATAVLGLALLEQLNRIRIAIEKGQRDA